MISPILSLTILLIFQISNPLGNRGGEGRKMGEVTGPLNLPPPLIIYHYQRNDNDQGGFIDIFV